MRWLAVLIAGTLPLQASAIEILPACASGTGLGNCSTCDLFALGANLAALMLEFLGGAVLLMVVIGGVMWIVSAGNPNMVQKGQAILVGAAVGTFIVLGAYFIVNAVIASFTADNDFEDVQLFDTNWANYCEAPEYTLVQDCTGRQDGDRCFNSSCNDDENCQCFSGQCITECEVTYQNFPGTQCVADENACNGENGGYGLCPSNGVCCAPNGTFLTDEEIELEESRAVNEESCDSLLEQDWCLSETCTDINACVCNADGADGGQCVSLCEYSYSSATSAGRCTDTETCTGLGGTDHGEGEGCLESTICCEIPI